MQRNMKQWVEQLKTAPVKPAMPILSFPSIQLLGITVKDLISDSDVQARGMKAVADNTPKAAASVSLMDLSVEAECFGAKIRISEDEVPTVIQPVLSPDLEEEERMAQAEAMPIPAVGAGRTGIYLDAIRKAVQMITDRPVFAGVIGPFSLAGRLLDVTEAMVYCYSEPDMVHQVLRKATDFLIAYIKAYRDAGANGVVIAEPLAGLLSPSLAQEFSGDYCKEIVDAVQEESFIVIYHNCGNTATLTLDSILSCGAMAYRFGNAVSMEEILQKLPAGTLAMGNIDPAGEFRGGTPESIRKATQRVMEACCRYPNFLISSGCDIPPMSPWKNINAFFDAVSDYYAQHSSL